MKRTFAYIFMHFIHVLQRSFNISLSENINIIIQFKKYNFPTPKQIIIYHMARSMGLCKVQYCILVPNVTCKSLQSLISQLACQQSPIYRKKHLVTSTTNFNANREFNSGQDMTTMFFLYTNNINSNRENINSNTDA